MLYPILVLDTAALITAGSLAKSLYDRDTGTPPMQRVSNAVKQVADLLFQRQTQITLLFLLLFSLVSWGAALIRPGYIPTLPRIASLALGVFGSLLTGWVANWAALRTKIRTAAAAREGFKPAARLSMRAGIFLAIATCGIAILCTSLLLQRITRALVRRLEKLGHHVTLTPNAA